MTCDPWHIGRQAVRLSLIALVIVVADARAGDQVPIEYARINVNDFGFTQVDFRAEFSVPPIVVATPLSYSDTEPATVQIRNVTTDGFEIRIQTFDYQVAVHGAEAVSYLAVEPGRYALDGMALEAAAVTASSNSSDVLFVSPFVAAPVVQASVIRDLAPADPSAVVVRLDDISTSKFTVELQEQETGDAHAAETLHYIAWTPGTGMLNGMPLDVFRSTDSQTHSPSTYVFPGGAFENTPALLADMQSRDGGDPANLRVFDINASSVRLLVHEEQSDDAEQNHTSETIGYTAIEEPRAFLHDGSAINQVAMLEQVDTDVVVRFRVQNESAADVTVNVDSIEFYDPDADAFVDVDNNLVDLGGGVFSSAADLTGMEHQFTWQAGDQLGAVMLDGLRVRFQVSDGVNNSPIAISPEGFVFDSASTIFVHDGATLNVLPALEQIGGEVVVRFRVQNQSGNPVDVDPASLEYFDPDANAFVAIDAADVDGPLTNLVSATDLGGVEHELVWRANDVPALSDMVLNGLRVRFRVSEGGSFSPLAISPDGFVLDLMNVISAHDGSTLDVLPLLIQDGTNIRIRFRARTTLGGDVNLESLSFFSGANDANLMPISLADVSGNGSFASATDLSGIEHELIWDTSNTPSMVNAVVNNLRIRLVLRQGLMVSSPADSPNGFNFNSQSPLIDSSARVATEGVPFLSSPVVLGNLANVTFSSVQLPGWAEFDTQSGQLIGTPTNTDVGSFDVLINASINNGPDTPIQFSLVVQNTPPVINSAPPQRSFEDGDEFVYDVESVGEGDGRTTYTFAGPEFLTIDATNGRLTGTVDSTVGDLSVTVNVNDGNGGLASQQFTLDVLTESLTVEAGDSITIASDQPARLDAAVRGGRAPYDVFWSNGDDGSSTVVEPSQTTVYSAIVFDADGRRASDDVTVTVVEPLSADIDGPRNVVRGETTTLSAIVTGGMPPYELLWSTIETDLIIDVTVDESLSVSLTVIDALGSGAVVLADIEPVDPLSVSIVASGLADDPNAFTVAAEVAGGVEPFIFFWSTGERTESIDIPIDDDSPFVLVVSDAIGQFSTTSATINDFAIDGPAAQPAPNGICGALGGMGMVLWCFVGLGLRPMGRRRLTRISADRRCGK